MTETEDVLSLMLVKTILVKIVVKLFALMLVNERNAKIYLHQL
jgi:hypothetical protein